MSKKIKIVSVLSVLCAVLFSISLISASAVTYLKGDVNLDNKISSSDARNILRMALKLEPLPAQNDIKFKLADFDDSGKINSGDARSTLRVALKLEKQVSFEVPDSTPSSDPKPTPAPSTEPSKPNPTPAPSSDPTKPDPTPAPSTAPSTKEPTVDFGPGSGDVGSVDIGNLG